MGIMELIAVALTALLSENFILVNCMGIGTRVQSFKDPSDALRTGSCLTVVMVLRKAFPRLGTSCTNGEEWMADHQTTPTDSLASWPSTTMAC